MKISANILKYEFEYKGVHRKLLPYEFRAAVNEENSDEKTYNRYSWSNGVGTLINEARRPSSTVFNSSKQQFNITELALRYNSMSFLVSFHNAHLLF